MRRFIVEVLLDAVLLLFIVLLLGIISVGQPFPFGPTSVPILSLRGAGIIGFVSWAAVLVLVNRFARPVLVALTGRLLFSTMGFFVVIINAIAIYITSFFAPIKIADVADPTLPLGHRRARPSTPALSTVMDAVLGLNRPDLGADRCRGIWGFLESLPTPRRNAILENLRLQQVYNAIYSTSLDIALDDTPIGPIRRWFARVVLGDKDELDERHRSGADRGDARAARTDLREDRPDDGEPGATSCRPTGSPSCRSSRARPRRSPTTTSSRSSPRSWARRPRSSTRPSTRSRSPRHRPPRSTRPDSTTGRSSRSRSSDRGSRPRPRPTSASSRSWPASPSGGSRSPARSGSRRSSREFAQGVLKELDYRNEAYHARRLADGMQRFPEIHVPTVYDELSGQRVITMEFVNGIKISKADELRAAGFDTTELGTVFIRAIIKQVLVDGFFHGDPHPGNILADPISKQIIFLDLGLVGQLSAQQRVDLLGLIYSIKEVDIPGIGDGLLALGKPTRQFDEAALPRRHRSPRPSVPDLRQGDLARGRRSGRSCPPSSTTACSSTAS